MSHKENTVKENSTNHAKTVKVMAWSMLQE